MIGVPLGHHLLTGATVCADPISWFTRAHLISNPSVFIQGLPGLGKSSLAARIATGLAGYGVQPLVLGDLKPDYVDVIRALGGQVIGLGHGRGHLNILDPGEATDAIRRLEAAGHTKQADQIRLSSRARRETIVEALITIVRSTAPTDRERNIVSEALRILDTRAGIPILSDLLSLIRAAPESVRAAALDRGDMTRYANATEDLEASLMALTNHSRLGETFNAPTDEPMHRDKPVVYDVSGIGDDETDLQAAALLACWSSGFGTIEVAHALTDAGLEPERHYLVVLDELWRVLRAGAGMVSKVDALTRTNRTWGVGQIMCTHTMRDLEALPTEEDRANARGFVERAGMVICGGLPDREMSLLNQVVPMSDAERGLLASWTVPPAWDSRTGKEGDPPGRGNFLIKIGGRPGIPIHVDLTAAELAVHDTNARWKG